MSVRPGQWITLPAHGSDPLARLQIVLNGVVRDAFRENDHALLRCPDIAPGAYRVQVLAGGRTVHSSAIRVS